MFKQDQTEINEIFNSFNQSKVYFDDPIWKKVLSLRFKMSEKSYSFYIDQIKSIFGERFFDSNIYILMLYFISNCQKIFNNSENYLLIATLQEEIYVLLFLINFAFNHQYFNKVKTELLPNSYTTIIDALKLKSTGLNEDALIIKEFIRYLLELIMYITMGKLNNFESILILLQTLTTFISLLSEQLYHTIFLVMKPSINLLPSKQCQPLSIIYDVFYYDPKIRTELAVPIIKTLLWLTNPSNLKEYIRDRNTEMKKFLHQQKLMQGDQSGSFVIHYGAKIAGLYNGIFNHLPLLSTRRNDELNNVGSPPNAKPTSLNFGNADLDALMSGTFFDPDKQPVPSYAFCSFEEDIFPATLANGSANEGSLQANPVQKVTKPKTTAPLMCDIISRQSELLLCILITSSVPPPLKINLSSPHTDSKFLYPTTSQNMQNSNSDYLNDKEDSNKYDDGDNRIAQAPVFRENPYLEIIRNFVNDTDQTDSSSNSFVSPKYDSLHGIKEAGGNASPVATFVNREVNGLVNSVSESEFNKNAHPASFQTNFNNLYTYFCSNIRGRPVTTLLFYLTFHHNKHFRAYTLARSDIEKLLLPILQNTYESTGKRTNSSKDHNVAKDHSNSALLPCQQLYMCLIICLMFTEDDLFDTSVHQIMIKCPSWFTPEHSNSSPIQQISLGSFMILVLLKVIQSNLSRVKDKYLHTNCLATISNMAPKFANLNPYASQRLITLYVLLLKHYVKLMKKFEELHKEVVPPGGDMHFKQMEMKDTLIEIQTFQEIIGMMLESFISLLNAPRSLLETNCHLVYTILYNERYFNPVYLMESQHLNILQNTPCYPTNLLTSFDTISSILQTISLRLNSESENEAFVVPTNSMAQVPSFLHLSVEEAMKHLKQILKILPDRSKKNVPNTKFKYVEEEWPEIFFIPYTWSLVCRYAMMYFDFKKIKIFNPLDYYEF